MKLLVPSIGSSTHIHSLLPPWKPVSSPKTLCEGQRCLMSVCIAASASWSAIVTGDRSALTSTGTGVRK